MFRLATLDSCRWCGVPATDWARLTFHGFLNHATPLYCWREEQPLRGALSAHCVGDMPHNWASAECILFLRHTLALEDGGALRLLPPYDSPKGRGLSGRSDQWYFGLMPLQTGLAGIAGVHFVVSELTRRGFIALPTTRNTAGVDILVSGDPHTNAFAYLQVKASQYKVSFWPTGRPEKCLRGKRSFYVFVRFLLVDDRYEAFIVKGEEVYKQVSANLRSYRRRGRKEFTYWQLPRDAAEVKRLRRAWKTGALQSGDGGLDKKRRHPRRRRERARQRDPTRHRQSCRPHPR